MIFFSLDWMWGLQGSGSPTKNDSFMVVTVAVCGEHPNIYIYKYYILYCIIMNSVDAFIHDLDDVVVVVDDDDDDVHRHVPQ